MEESERLRPFGWDEEWARAASGLRAGPRDSVPGRVVRVDKGWATVATAPGTIRAKTAGNDVATGDWVLVARGAVAGVLPRRSTFVRGDPIEGRARKPQVVAANVDVVLVVQSLTNGPNLRRLERELVLAFESGAMPVVVLTKADLVDDARARQAVGDAASAAPDVEVIATSAVTGAGVEQVRVLAHENRTLALIGASGVGKSTLVNALTGEASQATRDVRAHDQRGRHTTTARELISLPDGGLVVDTPGLRAVSLWDADEGLARVFADIEALAAQCRFANCTHNTEPGCAVLAAIDAGTLDPARFEHYRRLDAELDERAAR